MTHQEAIDLLPLLVAHELTHEQRLQVDAHLEDCADCCRELAELQATYNLIADGLHTDATPVLDPAHLAAITGTPTFHTPAKPAKKRSLRHTLALAAMLAAALCILAGMLLPTLSKSKEKARRVNAAGLKKMQELERLMLEDEALTGAAASATNAFDDDSFSPLPQEAYKQDGKVTAAPSTAPVIIAGKAEARQRYPEAFTDPESTIRNERDAVTPSGSEFAAQGQTIAPLPEKKRAKNNNRIQSLNQVIVKEEIGAIKELGEKQSAPTQANNGTYFGLKDTSTLTQADASQSLGYRGNVKNTEADAPGQLQITTTEGLSTNGPNGGPFTPADSTYALSNVGGTDLEWKASKDTNWHTLSATSGTLQPGASTQVTVDLGSSANTPQGVTRESAIAFAISPEESKKQDSATLTEDYRKAKQAPDAPKAILAPIAPAKRDQTQQTRQKSAEQTETPPPHHAGKGPAPAPAAPTQTQAESDANEMAQFAEDTRPEKVDPERSERDDSVKLLLEQGRVFQRHSRNMDAREKFEQVLIRDPYNREASRNLQTIYKELPKDEKERRGTMISERAAEIDQKWVDPEAPLNPPPLRHAGKGAGIAGKLGKSAPANRSGITTTTVGSFEGDDDDDFSFDSAIPADDRSFDFEETSLSGDFGFDAPAAHPSPNELTITMDFDNIPLGEAIRYITEATGLKYRIEPYAVIIADPSVPLQEMETRFYPLSESSDSLPTDYFGREISIDKWLQVQGVELPEGARLVVDSNANKLIAFNTPENLRKIEELLVGINKMPKRDLPDGPIQKKLNDIIIPKISFEEATYQTVLRFLKERSKDLDIEGEGVNIFLRLPSRHNTYPLEADDLFEDDEFSFDPVTPDQNANTQPTAAQQAQAPNNTQPQAPTPAQFEAQRIANLTAQITATLADADTKLANNPLHEIPHDLSNVWGQLETLPADQAAPLRQKAKTLLGKSHLSKARLYASSASTSKSLDFLNRALNYYQHTIATGTIPASHLQTEIHSLEQLRRDLTKPKGKIIDDELPPIPLKPAPPVNPFVMTSNDHFSTFALEADTASYSVARRFIAKGYRPPPALVRMEEFINAFDYQYPRTGDNVFNVYSEAGPSPFGKDLTLLKIGVKGKVLGRDGQRPGHYIFVIDTSGSMERADRLPLVQYALKLLVSQLTPADRITIITYDMQARLYLEAASVQDRQLINQAIDNITCNSSTNLMAGVSLGYELARRHWKPATNNRILLCSDGVANVGSSDVDALLAQVANLRSRGITFTSVGVGSGNYNDEVLEQLANRGDGNYVYLNSLQDADRVFGEELSATLHTIAKDVKIQVEFDPARVRRYRLIGYENRDIADKDFRNDAVDAGEIGSGQSATALYEVELLPAPPDTIPRDLGTVRIRYKDIDTLEVTEFESRIASDLIRPRTATTDPYFCLAAGVAEFAEQLRLSDHARDTSFVELENYLIPVANQIAFDTRIQELLQLVRRSQGLPIAK